ncbi:MAG TPA: hypothetical protein VJ853_01055 [Thermoanaerobaculia bacterium]|nr:hypothetical protein [Thermoanaerobaculia bacterium]
MNDFRGPLPLNDRDFAEVRRNVLAKIEKRPPVIGWMIAAAAVIALVVILIPRRQPPAPSHPAVQAHKTVQPPIVIAPPQPETAQIHEPVKKPKRKPEPQPQLVADKGASPSDEEITMNIQTADPNVRIIWIARR